MLPADGIVEQLAPLLQGSYTLERVLGRGGMGVVYLAREQRLDRLVAIKVLPPHFATQPIVRERFLREARTAAQLSHPNIVPIYRAEEVGGYPYFAMGYIEGESLADRVRDRGPLPAAEVVRVLREAAWALAYAHARGVVHRDIKAANIMVERGSGRAVVTDFGIARDGNTASLTQAGEVVGTVHYMSPEQANGQPLDGRSDLYSLGVAGFFALSGRLPFEGDNPAAVLLAVATREAPSLASLAPTVARPLAEVIDRCLRRDPAARYVSGEALADALGQALERASRLDGPSQPQRVISEDHAQAVWLRAAQLQAEAASRLEQRSRQGEGLTSLGLAPPLPTGGYRLKDVEAAAAEVGIAPEFVALALAEEPRTQAAMSEAVGDRRDKLTTTLLGTAERSISVSRTIRATPKRVLEAIGQVFPARPFVLKFRDIVGPHPLDGGVMVFDVPNFMASAGSGTLENYTPFTMKMYQIELWQLNTTLHAVQAANEGATQVTVHGDLRPGLRKNLMADGWIAGVVAAGGAAAGGAVGWAALGLGLLSAAPAVAGAAALGGLSLAWYRWLYRRSLRKSAEELQQLLGAVETHLRSQAVFGVAPPPPAPPPRQPPDDGLIAMIS
jgi:predicted Ser/Thr protein kinase